VISGYLRAAARIVHVRPALPFLEKRRPQDVLDAGFAEYRHRVVDVLRVVRLIVVVADHDHDDGAELRAELRRTVDDVRRPDAVVRAARIPEAAAGGGLELEVDPAGQHLLRRRVVLHRGRDRVAEDRHADSVVLRCAARTGRAREHEHGERHEDWQENRAHQRAAQAVTACSRSAFHSPAAARAFIRARCR
jgi:hypothetical protein